MHALGIDIGGTGIKGAPVDVAAGKLLADRQKIPTPRPALPGVPRFPRAVQALLLLKQPTWFLEHCARTYAAELTLARYSGMSGRAIASTNVCTAASRKPRIASIPYPPPP